MPLDLSFDDPTSDVLLDPTTGVRRSILPGGVRLLTQTDRSVRSATIGLWLPVGSRDEAPAHAGSTHVLEHLLFKGTRRRNAMDIATAFDEVGATRTPSPPRSTPSTTDGSARRTSPWPWTCSPT